MEEALYSLCYTAQTFVAVAMMLFLLLAIAIAIANVFLKKLLLKTAVYVSFAISVVLLVL